MRLSIRKKNDYSYYSIIMDYTKLNGKRSTRIFEKLGNQNQVEERFGKNNTIGKIKEYINKFNDEYRTLSYIAENMDYIQKELFNNSKNVINRNSKVIYYDCTNYFFYTNENDFERYGISKQHQPLSLVGMELFMDGDGLPLSCNIYPGNMNEQKTLIPEENKIIKDFKLDNTKIIICTDAGLASDDIKKYNIKDGRGFVITQSLKKLNNKDLKEKYYDTIFYKIIQTETKSVKQDLIITFSFKYFDYNRNIRNNQIERTKKAIENGNVTRKGKNQNDYGRFINSVKSTNNGEIAENTDYF